jgi:hypothetical protein
MLKNSIIAISGQTWKLAVAVLALVAGSIVPAFPASGLSWTGGTILACVGYAFGILMIRCKQCGARWFWDALMRPEVYKAVFTEPDCPSCSSGSDSTGD